MRISKGTDMDSFENFCDKDNTTTNRRDIDKQT